MQNLRLMDSVGINLILQILFSILATINCASEQLIMSPTAAEVVHFVNDSHVVTCTGHTDSDIQWRDPKDREVTDVKGRIHVEKTIDEAPEGARYQNMRLVFKQIRPEDQGTWTCLIRDSDHNKRHFKMIVNEPIFFIDINPVQKAKEGETAHIKCKVKGNPVPKITWYFQGQQLQLNNDSKDANQRYAATPNGLSIQSVTRNDTGEYTCRAYQISATLSNLQEETIRLIVRHRPIPRRKTNNETAYGYLHGTVNLTCHAEAEPHANFTWYHGKKQLGPPEYIIYDGEHMSHLQIHVKNEKVLTEYRCEAKNNYGKIEHHITLKMGKKPPEPTMFGIKGVNQDSLSVDVGAKKADPDDPMSIIGYRFEIIPVAVLEREGSWKSARVDDWPTGEGTTYLIKHLNKATEYKIRAASINRAGISDFTPIQEFRTYPIEIKNDTGAGSNQTNSIIAMVMCLLFVFCLREEPHHLTVHQV